VGNFGEHTWGISASAISFALMLPLAAEHSIFGSTDGAVGRVRVRTPSTS